MTLPPPVTRAASLRALPVTLSIIKFDDGKQVEVPYHCALRGEELTNTQS